MVTSIVLNDDVVPRMSAQSIEALADQVRDGGLGRPYGFDFHQSFHPLGVCSVIRAFVLFLISSLIDAVFSPFGFCSIIVFWHLFHHFGFGSLYSLFALFPCLFLFVFGLSSLPSFRPYSVFSAFIPSFRLCVSSFQLCFPLSLFAFISIFLFGLFISSIVSALVPCFLCSLLFLFDVWAFHLCHHFSFGHLFLFALLFRFLFGVFRLFHNFGLIP